MSRVERASQLLEVAEHLIATSGVLETSMDDVAESAGVTKPIVYDHFGSKDGLLCALIERAGDELFERTQTAVAAAASPLLALESGLRAYFDTLDRRDGVWWALLDATAAVSPATYSSLEKIRDRQAGFIADLIEVEMPGDRLRALVAAHVIVGACERLAALRAVTPELTVDEATMQLLELLWCGLDELRGGARLTAGVSPAGLARRKSVAKPRVPQRRGGLVARVDDQQLLTAQLAVTAGKAQGVDAVAVDGTSVAQIDDNRRNVRGEAFQRILKMDLVDEVAGLRAQDRHVVKSLDAQRRVRHLAQSVADEADRGFFHAGDRHARFVGLCEPGEDLSAIDVPLRNVTEIDLDPTCAGNRGECGADLIGDLAGMRGVEFVLDVQH